MATPIDKIQQDFDTIKEKVELLDGSRNTKTKGRSAVRFDDLADIARFTTKMQSKQLTAAPTMADYNAMQADLKRVFDAIVSISTVITGKV